MSICTIRPFITSDAPALIKIIHACYKEELSKDYTSDIVDERIRFWTVEKLLKLSEDKERKIYVAEDSKSGKILGTVTLISLKIRTFFIDPQEGYLQEKGRKITLELLESVELEAIKNGIYSLDSISIKSAVEFWKLFGFIPTKEKKSIYNGIELPHIPMTKTLI